MPESIMVIYEEASIAAYHLVFPDVRLLSC